MSRWIIWALVLALLLSLADSALLLAHLARLV